MPRILAQAGRAVRNLFRGIRENMALSVVGLVDLRHLPDARHLRADDPIHVIFERLPFPVRQYLPPEDLDILGSHEKPILRTLVQ